MAHQIDMTTGTASVFVTGKPAWHGLGRVVKEAVSSDEAIKLAGLDWTIEQWLVRSYNPDTGEMAPISGKVANVRTDTKATLGIVTPSYHVFQNRELFNFMDDLVGERLCAFETAGGLYGGRIVWMMMRLPGEYRHGDDVVKPYTLLTAGHDGVSPARLIPTTIRVVCDNTRMMALNMAASGEGITIYHFHELKDRIEAARAALKLVTARMDRFGDEMKRLIARKMTDAELAAYFNSLANKAADGQLTKVAAKWVDEWQTRLQGENQRVSGIAGTAWAAYNAVSEWADHRQVKGQSDDQRLNSVWFGGGAKLKDRAWDAAMELAQ